MKKITFALLAFSTVFISGCATVQKKPAYEGKKIKTAFFIDNGSSGAGVIHIARLLSYSPQIDLTMVKGEDLRKNKLAGFDLLVMPGGNSATQMKSMKPEGVAALLKFIKDGGSYYGICAGCSITTTRPERASIFPYKYDKSAVGAKAVVLAELSEKGAKILDIPQAQYQVYYSHGPIMKEASWEKGNCETLAVYKSSVGPNNRRGKSFYGTPALLYGNFGKGKVIATSFHPEYHIRTHHIFNACFYAVTGVKITQNFPVKNYRPLRIAYYFHGFQKKDPRAMYEEMLALDKSPEVALQFGLDYDMCANVDMVILADAADDHWQAFTGGKRDEVVKDFLNKGGIVVCAGSVWDKLPDHKNLIRLKNGESVVNAALKIAGK